MANAIRQFVERDLGGRARGIPQGTACVYPVLIEEKGIQIRLDERQWGDKCARGSLPRISLCLSTPEMVVYPTLRHG
jgi:hypothetical protein